MSTKNLARTVIEGGRCNKWERRYSHAENRAHEKAYISEVSQDLENWYDYDVEPLEPVGKCFRDKLSPMSRWLASQCGRPWADVRSEVAKTFDTRTTAGRHIVYDHLLKSVEETPDYRYRRYYYGPEDFTTSYRRYSFYVDADGILREKTVVKRKDSVKIPKFNTAQIANWLSGRVVGKVGNKLFWFTPAQKARKHRGLSGPKDWMTQWGYAHNKYSYYSNYGLNYYYLNKTPIYKYDKGVLVYENDKPIIIGYESSWSNGTPNFRQDRKLNDKEMAFWNTIPEYYQTQVLEYSPTWDGPPRSSRYPYYY